MLYDKRWDKTTETKADPFSLDTLIAWLEKQPADKVYCYCDTGECLLAQYFTAMGFDRVSMRIRYFGHGHGDTRVGLPPNFNAIAANSGDYFEPISGDFTFGAALDRARMFRGQQ